MRLQPNAQLAPSLNFHALRLRKFSEAAMSSCEPHHTSAYSEDLRWRMVWQVEALGYSKEQVARNVGVHKSTVSRTLELFYSTGSVGKKQYPKEKAFRKLTTPAQLLILHLVLEKPGIYLYEIQRDITDVLQLQIDTSTICRFLHQSGFTRQKLRLVAVQRDNFLRQKFALDVSLYRPDMLVFLDETGSDQRNMLRKYSYSIRGKTPQNHTLLARGEHMSALAFMSVSGILDVSIVKGTTNGDKFYDIVQKCLLPHLLPFDGVNCHSVVVLDNCSIHHIPEVAAMIEEVGAIVHYLPPYSPDFNPIEEAFSKVKREMKSLERNMQDISDVETILLAAFASITAEDCCGWISHCNIYNL